MLCITELLNYRIPALQTFVMLHCGVRGTVFTVASPPTTAKEFGFRVFFRRIGRFWQVLAGLQVCRFARLQVCRLAGPALAVTAKQPRTRPAPSTVTRPFFCPALFQLFQLQRVYRLLPANLECGCQLGRQVWQSTRLPLFYFVPGQTGLTISGE